MFIFYEQYKDDAAFDAHRKAPHLAAYRERREKEGLTEGSPEVDVPVGHRLSTAPVGLPRPRDGYVALTRMKATRQGWSLRLLHAWLVPRWTRQSPASSRVSPRP